VTAVHGRVAGVFVASAATAPMEPVEAATAVAGVGLDGDRYAAGVGTWSEDGRLWGQVTLIEAEAVEAVARETGSHVDPSDTRRNVVTTGVPLNHLVDREFRVGEATLRGVRLCEPCTHLERVSGKPLRKPLVHRGGLNALIVDGGTIRVGDAVTAPEEDP